MERLGRPINQSIARAQPHLAVPPEPRHAINGHAIKTTNTTTTTTTTTTKFNTTQQPPTPQSDHRKWAWTLNRLHVIQQPPQINNNHRRWAWTASSRSTSTPARSRSAFPLSPSSALCRQQTTQLIAPFPHPHTHTLPARPTTSHHHRPLSLFSVRPPSPNHNPPLPLHASRPNPNRASSPPACPSTT